MGAILGGRYAVRGFLGQGGLARVYLAEDAKTAEPVALKILEPPWAHDKVARDRFTKAAAAAQAIPHESLVRILAVTARGDGTPFVVMEHLFGESLGDYLRRNKVMDAEIGLPVLREVALALEAAHESGVVHRGLKPENIYLVGEPGEPYAVRVLDLGFGHLRDATVTTNGTVAGSANPVAPEQCVADEVDARTDVFALGLVMYHVFTGVPAFSAESPDELLARCLVAPHRPPRAVTPDIDPNIEAIIDKCLRKDPGVRYESMAHLRADIEAVAEGYEPDAAMDTEPKGEVYQPRGMFSKLVAKALYRRLSVPPPSFLA